MGLRDRLKGPPPAAAGVGPPSSAGGGGGSAPTALAPRPTGSVQGGQGGQGQGGQTGQWSGITTDIYQNLKHELHQKLIEKLDLRTIEKLGREQLRDELRAILSNLLQGTELPLNRQEREHMVEELLDEVTGLGPLEPLLRDQAISDILVNKFDTIYIEKFGKLELTTVRFRDNEHLTQIINRIVSRVGRRVDD